MDTIIQETDFIHDDKEVAEEFKIRIETWKKNNRESIATGQINSAFQTMGKKLMESKCPTFKTEGWHQAVKLWAVLEDLAGDQIMVGTTHPDEFHEMFYKMMLDWFQSGPATVQMEIIMSILNHRPLGMKEFTTSLKDERLNKLLRALTSPLVKKEDTTNKLYYDAYRGYNGYFVKVAFEDSQLMMEDSMKILIDFVFHMYVDYFHLENDCTNNLVVVAKLTLRMYTDKWKNFSDVPRLKTYIQKFVDLAKTPGFPRNKAIGDWTYEALAILTKRLQTFGKAEEFSNEMFDLMEVMSQGQGEKEQVVRAFSAAVVFFDQRGGSKNNPTVFKAVAPRYKAMISTLDVAFLKDTRFVSDIMTMLEKSYADNKELTTLWLSLSIPLMRRQTLKTLYACRSVLSKHDKIKWKEHQEFVVELLAVFKEITVPQDSSRESCLKEVTSTINYLLRGLKRARIHKDYGETLLYLSVHLLELGAKELFDAAEDVGETVEINVKEKKDSVMEVMKRLHVIIQDENMPWDNCFPLQRAVTDIIESVFKCVKDGKIFSEEDLVVFTSICATCLEKDIVNSDSGNLSHHFLIALKIMNTLLEWLGAANKLSLATHLAPLLISKLDEEDNTAHTCVGGFLGQMANLDADMLAPSFDTFVKIFLERETWEILLPLSTIYSNTGVTIKSHFQQLFTHMIDTDNKGIKSTLHAVFLAAAKKEVELFTEDNMKDLIQLARSDASFQAMYLQTVQEVCKRTPEKLVNHIDILMKRDGWNSMLLSMINDVLSTLALYEKTISSKILDYFIQSVKTTSDKGALVTALNAIRLMWQKYPDVVKPKRQGIDDLQIVDADGQGQKQNILDMIDGKTSKDVKKQLDAQQEAVSGLVEKVEDVEGTVAAVAGDLEEHKQGLDNVKNDVTEQAQRLDQVEETVEDTVKKVEEIDNKTLSHAPYWSRDISKLLNPATDHDWRLLSSRLGYSNADIRGWAQQADPCMALLNEWYATRKTSEATYAILTNLQEMNRMDAALIVENAMKKAEAVVEDEEFGYASPPEIFISYQWGHQEEVKLLHRHLAMAGYDCWMDIGQMGGGDKLFEKIDNGMRAAKLVISCVTEKYAKSPNCNREVNLAVGVKKPIIPLLLENCPWPPPGSMGPIFSESLYIQFFQTGQEETNDDRFWPVEKFQELLMQLSANGLVPDEGKIDKVYKNWWIPLEQTIVIDKSKTQSEGNVKDTQTQSDNQPEESPDVFISYQWGKQTNVIKLYQRLTSLGFSCWLDIKQMGGGDSLYDKIDRGIRGSKVVVPCVTKPYSMSANCRREVSLADVLKKPLVPLLLEDMAWPPPGPMSMAMTQLLYIGFQQESLQTSWEGPEFDQLVDKIKSFLGEAVPANQPGTQSPSENTTGQHSGSGEGEGQNTGHDPETKDKEKEISPNSESNKEGTPPVQIIVDTCSQSSKSEADPAEVVNSQIPPPEEAQTAAIDADQKGKETHPQTSNGEAKPTQEIQPQTSRDEDKGTRNTQPNSQTQNDETKNTAETHAQVIPEDGDKKNDSDPSQAHNDKDGRTAHSQTTKDEVSGKRPQSAIPKRTQPGKEGNSSNEGVLPPLNMRLQTSRSCSIL